MTIRGETSIAVRARLHALVAALALTACADAQATHTGTETGNAPVIDVSALSLVLSHDTVHAKGRRGAVDPGAIEIVIQTLSTGDKARGHAAKDGSFDIAVDGWLDDTYELHALGAHDMQSVQVYLDRDGAAALGHADGGELSCTERGDLIESQFDRLAADADRSCVTNSDCTLAVARATCPAWQCGVAMSQEAQAEIAATVETIGEDLCDPFAADACGRNIAQPECAAGGAVACVDGECIDCSSGDCPETSCTPCEFPELTWFPVIANDYPIYNLTDCKTLTRRTADGSCSTQLPCVPAQPSEAATWSVLQVQNALGHPDVRAELAGSQPHHGGSDLYGFRISLSPYSDPPAFVIGHPLCSEAPEAADCSNPPEGLVALREVLISIGEQSLAACTIGD